jgi:hypothetical protein
MEKRHHSAVVTDMAWYIRYSGPTSSGFVTKEPTAYPHQPVLADSVGCDQKFPTREAAVAWVLRYVDARIVTNVSDMSAMEATCVIEELG